MFAPISRLRSNHLCDFDQILFIRQVLWGKFCTREAILRCLDSIPNCPTFPQKSILIFPTNTKKILRVDDISAKKGALGIFYYTVYGIHYIPFPKLSTSHLH